VPYLDLWHHRNKPDWFDPLDRHRLPVEPQDPLALQIQNLCDVIRGTAKPIVPGREGLNTLKVIEAVKQAADTGTLIHVAPEARGT
jgi:predicted dehydrogenase